MGLIDDQHVPFGKYRGHAIGNVPSSYLRWCLEQDWFERKYEELIEPFEQELAWRDQFDVHFEDVASAWY